MNYYYKITDPILEDYKKWFAEKLEDIELPPWTSLEGNIYWIGWTHKFGEYVNRKFHEVATESPRLLDMGAGKGFLSFLLAASNPDAEVCVADIQKSPFFSAYAEKLNLSNLNFSYIKNNILSFSSEWFDVVLLTEVLEHSEDPKKTINEAYRVLKKGGILIVTTPPRFRFLFRKDPHFRIRFLYLLPLFLQNFIVENLLKYHKHPGYFEYGVKKIFWNKNQFKKLLGDVDCEVKAYPDNSSFFWRRIEIKKK